MTRGCGVAADHDATGYFADHAALRFQQQVGAQYGDLTLEPRQHRLANAERLDRGLVGAGEQMLVDGRRHAEKIADHVGKRKMHGKSPVL